MQEVFLNFFIFKFYIYSACIKVKYPGVALSGPPSTRAYDISILVLLNVVPAPPTSFVHP